MFDRVKTQISCCCVAIFARLTFTCWKSSPLTIQATGQGTWAFYYMSRFAPVCHWSLVSIRGSSARNPLAIWNQRFLTFNLCQQRTFKMEMTLFLDNVTELFTGYAGKKRWEINNLLIQVGGAELNCPFSVQTSVLDPLRVNPFSQVYCRTSLKL